ncbi:polyketide synthase [Colwellia sp. MSW7]|uniref:Polyketide synthase n=1 Tax=Colwellia maritima TaxID=2912588 RepID=A0ABS9X7H2_9GAMM|nr:polyketide synthase [Colwellia maritima]MCI2286154.1 polyketide synthase [Colwellia maritima]
MNNTDYISSQISYQMNLKGPSYTIRTACSSSLAAVHLACQALWNYECDMALFGGVTIRVPKETSYQYVDSGILSKDGHCKAFSAQATGTVFSNGAGLIAIKRLNDAVNDGDQILAVIKGTACNNDGGIKGSFTAPSVEGQVAVIEEALAHAEVSPDDIDYIEAHGTGTDLGDMIELTALEKVFTRRKRNRQPLLIGSVKSNIGHLDAASGIAGLIKTVLALKNCQLPANLHAESPREEFGQHDYPLRLNRSLTPWPHQFDGVRCAGVSSFGVGGTNVHIVLQQAPESMPLRMPDSGYSPADDDFYTFRLSARNWRDLDGVVGQLENFLLEKKQDFERQDTPLQYQGTVGSDTAPLVLTDLSGTLEQGRRDFSHRLGIVCDSYDALIRGLQKSRNLIAQASAGRHSSQTEGHKDTLPSDDCLLFLDQVPDQPRLLLLFPGYHQDSIACVRSFYVSDLQFREEIDHCFKVAHSVYDGFPESSSILNMVDISVGGDGNQKPDGDLSAAERLCTFIAEYVFARILNRQNIHPCGSFGSGIGILAAACISEVIDVTDACRLLAVWEKKDLLFTILQNMPFRATLYPGFERDRILANG